jgi:hypothetical protein
LKSFNTLISSIHAKLSKLGKGEPFRFSLNQAVPEIA